jgi:hypothetical protein
MHPEAQRELANDLNAAKDRHMKRASQHMRKIKRGKRK